MRPIAIRTPWIDAADHIVRGRSTHAAEMLTGIGAAGIANLVRLPD